MAGTFTGRARHAVLALVDGAPGAVWAPGGRPRIVFDFTISGDRVAGIDLLADAVHLRQLDLQVPGDA